MEVVVIIAILVLDLLAYNAITINIYIVEVVMMTVHQ